MPGIEDYTKDPQVISAFHAKSDEVQQAILGRMAAQANPPPRPSPQLRDGEVSRSSSSTVTPSNPQVDPPPGLPSEEIARFKGGAMARGVLERTADPAYRLMFGPHDPITTASDLTQVGAMGAAALGYAPALALAAGRGAVMQGAAETLGAPPSTARLLGSATELISGMAGAAAGVMQRGAAAGKQLLGLGRQVAIESRVEAAPGIAQMTARETMGKDVQEAARHALATLQNQLGPEVGAAETAIVRQFPQVATNSPAYGTIAREIQTLGEQNIVPAGKNAEIFKRINNAIANNQPIDTADIAALRKGMIGIEDKAFNYAAGDMQTKFLKTFRRNLGDAMEQIPDGGSPLSGQLADARNAYLNMVVKPRKALRTVLSENTPLARAYDAVFGLGDNQQAYRATYQLLQKGKDGFDGAIHEGLINKLRAGFMEKLLTSQGGSQTMEMFRGQRNTLASTGLFSESDLNSLEYVIRSGKMPEAMEKITNAIGSRLNAFGPVGKIAGGVGALSVGYHVLPSLISHNPAGLVGLVVAGGGINSMRRLLLAPKDSQMYRELGGLLMNSALRAAKTIRHVQHTGPEQDDGLSDE